MQSTIEDLETHREPRGKQPFSAVTQSIELRNVSLSFGEAKVLRGVNLTIPRHQTVALVGESGAGKSTLVDALTGVLRPESGQILFDGVELSELDLVSLRSRVGYVPAKTA